MRVEISGFKNLYDFKCDFTEGKINVIYGKSGCGKSSIYEALLNKDFENNKSVDFEGEISVKVDGSDKYNISVFDRDKLNDYVINKKDTNFYSVLVDDDKALRKEIKELENLVQELKTSLYQSDDLFQEYKTVQKELGCNSLTKDNKLTAKSKILKLESALNTTNKKSFVLQIEKMPNGKLKWIKDGEKYRDNEHCPYCNLRLSKSNAEYIDFVNKFEAKSVDKYIELHDKLPTVGDALLAFNRKSVHEAVNIIRNLQIAIKDYENIANKMQNIDYLNVSAYVQTEMAISDELKTYFPDVYMAAKNINKKNKAVIGRINQARNKTKTILNKRINPLNNHLKALDIPYSISASYSSNNSIKGYKISLNNDVEQKDRPTGLSNGEKNLVALLMFIYECKNNDNIIIIDDPASDYDDYRMNQIYNIVSKELKNRTVIILSHNCAFAKYALTDRYNKGLVQYFTNTNKKTELQIIQKDDFNDFNEFVIDRILRANDYYSKIFNLRLLYEGKRGFVYQYLSAIVHCASKYEVETELTKVNKEEKDVFNEIYKKFPQLKEIQFEEYDDKKKISIRDYTLIEKAFYIREKCNDKDIKKELSDMIHLNQKLKVCLNPYKFEYRSNHLDKYLKENDFD